jgi:hypothetical protein
MSDSKKDPLVCSNCEAEVQADDDFCPECGELFAENIFCSVHPTQPAAGICIVCAKPFCESCGGRVQNHFLCHEHDALHIFEGMARVYRSTDAAEAVYAKGALEGAGLHPQLFSRRASPISIDGVDFTPFPAPGEYGRRAIDGFTVMVPCQEVVPAEKKLREEEFIE